MDGSLVNDERARIGSVLFLAPRHLDLAIADAAEQNHLRRSGSNFSSFVMDNEEE